MNAGRRAAAGLRFSLLSALGAFVLATSCVTAGDPSQWEDVQRVVAVGDVHGDYEQFLRILSDAGVIDDQSRWIAGKTHLVQLGDVVDRGPDSAQAMDLLMSLQKQARKAGGRVHALVGNHEAMNIIGDLRYVHPGEYAAFVSPGSRRLQTSLYQQTVRRIQRSQPEESWPEFDDAYEAEFRAAYPLGYVEHRRAWSPRGTYGRWVLDNPTVIRIDDTLFVHGGLSGDFEDLSLTEINQAVRRELQEPEATPERSLTRSERGPLWYRGLAQADSEDPDEQARVESMLQKRGARRIVVAHTSVTGAVLPRFGGKVVLIDVGLAAYYGGRLACLIIEGGELFALHRGKKLPLPVGDQPVEPYLREAAALDPQPSPIDQFLQAKSAARVGETPNADAAPEQR